jgi:MATE family multidrug resistance protein
MAMASTDSIFVGHYNGGDHHPGDYLAASALSDMVTTLLVVPPLAFNQVLNALCGQAVGSGKKKMAGVWLQQSLFWLGISMLPFMVGFFYVKEILHLLGFGDVICQLAGTYAKYNVFWPIPNGWYQCMRFYFQAVGKPRPAMYNSIVFLFINALLNWVFVFGGPFRHMAICGNWRGLGFVGAAVSLSCSRCMQPLAYWLYMFVWRRAHREFWPGWDMREHTWPRTKEFLTQGVPLVGTLVFGAVVGQATTLLVSKLGTDAVAATTAVSTATVVWAGAINAMFSMAGGINPNPYTLNP